MKQDSKPKTQQAKAYTYRQLQEIDAALEGLMLSPAIGVKNSLLLHKNRKMIEPILKTSSEELEVVKKKCFKYNEQGELELVNKQPVLLDGITYSEYTKATEAILNETSEIIFNTMKIDDLPDSKEYGKVNGIDLYINVPRLFDSVLVE